METAITDMNSSTRSHAQTRLATYGFTAIDLIQRGYEPVPIPHGYKYPVGVVGWEGLTLTENSEDFRRLLSQYPDAGIGVRTGELRAVDLDILDPELAKAVHARCLWSIGDPGGYRVGQPPKRMLFYWRDREFGELSKLASSRWRDPSTGDIHRIEILGEGQQVVVAGRHPSGGSYVWHGQSHLDVAAWEWPEITRFQEKELCDWFDDECRTRGWEQVGVGSGDGVSAMQWGSDQECRERERAWRSLGRDQGRGGPERSDLRGWLAWFDPTPRDSWIAVGQWVKGMVVGGVISEAEGWEVWSSWALEGVGADSEIEQGIRWAGFDGSRCGPDRLFGAWCLASGAEAAKPGWWAKSDFTDVSGLVGGVSGNGGKKASGGAGAGAVPPLPPFVWVDPVIASQNQQPPSWLIEGLVPEVGVGLLFGDPGTFKSFVALDMALTVAVGASGRLWGRGVGKGRVGCRTLYLAMEGSGGLLRRVRGWCERAGVAAGGGSAGRFGMRGGLTVALGPGQQGSNEGFLAALRDAVAQDGPIALTVLDTLSQSFSGDENAASEIAVLLQICTRAAEITRGFVLLVHHSGHVEKGRGRGSSALAANVDVVLQVSKVDGDPRVVSVSTLKQKEAEEARDFYLRAEDSPDWLTLDGAIDRSLVMVHDPMYQPPAASQQPGAYPLAGTLTPSEREVFDAIEREVQRTGSSTVTVSDIQQAGAAEGRGDSWLRRVKSRVSAVARKTGYIRVSPDGLGVEWDFGSVSERDINSTQEPW